MKCFIAWIKSVWKWFCVLTFNKSEKGEWDCGFCQLYHVNVNKNVHYRRCCLDCPICKRSGRKYCNNTPFRYNYYTVTGPGSNIRHRIRCWLYIKWWAFNELMFLVMLWFNPIKKEMEK